MFYKVVKKVFYYSVNVLEFIRVFLVFLAFFTILYWFMQLWGFPFSGFIFDFFEGIKNFVHIFYKRVVTTDEASVDFSFLIAALSMLFISWGLKPAVEQIKFAEEKYDAFCKKMRQKEEDIYNSILETQSAISETRNNKFLVLLTFPIVNLAKNTLYDKDVNIGVEEKKQEIVSEVLQSLSKKYRCRQALSNNNILLNFEDFESINYILDNINETLDTIKQRYHKEKWQINYIMSIEVYATQDELAQKMKNLNVLNKLNFKNEAVCLASFKQRYSLIGKQKYNIEGKGIFQISEAHDTEVFSIKIFR